MEEINKIVSVELFMYINTSSREKGRILFQRDSNPSPFLSEFLVACKHLAALDFSFTNPIDIVHFKLTSKAEIYIFMSIGLKYPWKRK